MDLTEENANKLNDFITTIENNNSITIGASIGAVDDAGYIDSLNEMLKNGEITAEKATALLNSIGYDPDIEYDTVK